MATDGETTIAVCITKGVEGGCIILTTSDKKQYALHGKSLPEVGKGLEVQAKGKPGGVDTCMEGTPFQVSAWNWTREKCPK